ncbi:unnamed protein product [Oncorhynchus mykiss]|uniref:Uncharacterized protein n=1 Tax=Oncorhynchus mykiss TaxID=8022 RepID=A0A060WSZ3_ONCMY|nr:unnamed protein product [Oncorhynchus mykiss]
MVSSTVGSDRTGAVIREKSLFIFSIRNKKEMELLMPALLIVFISTAIAKPFNRPGHHNGPQFNRPGHHNGPQFNRPGHHNVPQFNKPGHHNGPQFNRPGHHNGPQFNRPGHHNGPRIHESSESDESRMTPGPTAPTTVNPPTPAMSTIPPVTEMSTNGPIVSEMTPSPGNVTARVTEDITTPAPATPPSPTRGDN